MLHTLAPHARYAWLVLASFIAGVLNAVAGGGSFLSFPAMLGVGVPPIQANATNTVALWPGQLTSVAALRADLRRDLLPPVLLASLLGGTAGAFILLHTGQATFVRLIPWLLLVGTLLFWASAPVSRLLRHRAERRLPNQTLLDQAVPGQTTPAQTTTPPRQRRPATLAPAVILLALLPVCLYIGYFGAGSGFLILSTLALLGLQDLHELNALKVVAACVANLCATLTFILSGDVLWHFCLISMLFAALGGWVGARNSRRLSPSVLRNIVIVVGLAMAAYFFYRQHTPNL